MSYNSLLIDVVRSELIDIDSLPFSPYEGAETVLKAPCLYFVMNPIDVVIYVGKTQRKDRFKDHHRLLDFNAHKAIKVAYWQQPNHFYLSLYEGQFIRKLDGLLNVSENRTFVVLPVDEIKPEIYLPVDDSEESMIAQIKQETTKKKAFLEKMRKRLGTD